MLYLSHVLITLRDKFADKERGATAVEYALVIGLVSIAFVAALIAINGSLDTLVNNIQTWFSNNNTVG